jgi:glycosyltransferase involved in cell wall biosynthesis
MSKNIAIVTSVFPPYRGGIGMVAYHHARLLRERGFDVAVFSPDYGDDYTGDENQLFRVVRVKPLVKYGNAAYVPSLDHQLKDFSTVILEYPFFGGAGAVYSAKKKYNFKLITYYHMDVVASGWPVRRSLSEVGKGMVFDYTTKHFLPKLIEASDMVLASSSDYAQHSDISKFWNENSQKFQVLPIGVDMEKFKPAEVDFELKKNLHIGQDEKIILFVGGLDRAHYFKGVEYLLRAITLINNRHPEPREYTRDKLREGSRHSTQDHNPRDSSPSAQNDKSFRVVIAGTGELQTEYRALAEKLNVKDKVFFTGGVSDKALVKLYQMAEVTVLPSIDKSEAFGIVLVESMACGTPVITSSLPGVRCVYEDAISGFSVPSKDEEQLAERISSLLNDPEKTKQMGQAARARVLEKFDWNVIADQLVELL